jgi:hypothetical protein
VPRQICHRPESILTNTRLPHGYLTQVTKIGRRPARPDEVVADASSKFSIIQALLPVVMPAMASSRPLAQRLPTHKQADRLCWALGVIAKPILGGLNDEYRWGKRGMNCPIE